MKSIRVCLNKRSYDIIVGTNILSSFGRYLKKLEFGKDAVIVTNPTITKTWGKRLSNLLNRDGFNVKFQEVPDTEKSKSIKTCLELLNGIAGHSKLKRVFIIAFGGGVIGDLAGFIASIYKRGISYVQLPTTLVAQADSAIGGKVAIDLKVGKNLAGAFYQPRLVFSEIDFLSTLPQKQLIEGLSEVIKYGVIKDRELFEFIEENLGKILRLDRKSLEFIVCRCSQIKARIVEQDEFDKLGIRAALNYGHTIGHAIEAASGYSKLYSHGKAIGLGMVAANFISRELGLISDNTCGRIENLLKRAGLPTRLKDIKPSNIYKAHLYDKKFIHGKNRFVLPLRIGGVKIIEGIPENIIKRAISLIYRSKR